MKPAQSTMTPDQELRWEFDLVNGTLWKSDKVCAGCNGNLDRRTRGCVTCFQRHWKRKEQTHDSG
jgi:hypothetical protein